MFAQVQSVGRKFSFWVLEGILVLRTAILAWSYSRPLLPGLRP